jgi:hypothetical protein
MFPGVDPDPDPDPDPEPIPIPVVENAERAKRRERMVGRMAQMISGEKPFTNSNGQPSKTFENWTQDLDFVLATRFDQPEDPEPQP